MTTDLTPIRNTLLSIQAREENGDKHNRFERGQQLLAAKSLCAHGEWLPFLESVKISKDDASELMRWANHWQISGISEVISLEPSDSLDSQKEISVISEVSPEQAEAAMPTVHAQREFLKAPPEVREVIKEIIKEDPEAEIKAAEIKRLKAELKRSQAETESAVQRNNRLSNEILNSEAWIEEMTNRSNQKLLDAVSNVFAGLESLRFDRIKLLEPTREALLELSTALSINDKVNL